jgi:hypothetical protein
VAATDDDHVVLLALRSHGGTVAGIGTFGVIPVIRS